MEKIIIIGAGASGIITALACSQNKKVILVEGNDKIGKKLVLTGNGKCNYWNAEIESSHYETENQMVLEEILTPENIQNTYHFLEELGVYPKIQNGYYYPYSKDAHSLLALLERKIKEQKIEWVPNFKVLSLEKKKGKFIVKSVDKTLEGDKVVLATGGKTYPKTGSDGTGYDLAKSFNHTLIPLLPTLTNLICKDKIATLWENIRVSAKVRLFINGKLEKEEQGEIQCIKKGLSGICIFNLSNKASRSLYLNQTTEIEIDFLPEIENFKTFLRKRTEQMLNPTLEDFLESLLNYKLMFLLLKNAKLDKNKRIQDLKKEECHALEQVLKHLRLEIIETGDDLKAQVTSGGINLNEINPQTLESKLEKNLYFTGEILDVSGDCGGYNLAFAFITGYRVGKNL